MLGNQLPAGSSSHLNGGYTQTPDRVLRLRINGIVPGKTQRENAAHLSRWFYRTSVQREKIMANPTKSLSAAACASLGISPEELRSLLSQIEAQLHHSEVYRRTLESLQSRSGEPLEGITLLIKALGREAIRLSLQNLITCYPQGTSTAAEAIPETLPTGIAPVTAPQPIPSNPKPAVIRSPKLSKAQLALQKAQQEREIAWKAIGEQLQKARYGRSLSLEQLYALTRIPLHELKALEAGDLQNLPEEVYLRGFVRRLSIVLGLDSQKILATLPEPDFTHSVIPSWSYVPAQKNKGVYLQPAHLYLGYTALMAGAVGGLAWLYGDAPSGAAQDHPPTAPELSVPTVPGDSYAQESFSTRGIPAPEVTSPDGL